MPTSLDEVLILQFCFRIAKSDLLSLNIIDKGKTLGKGIPK